MGTNLKVYDRKPHWDTLYEVAPPIKIGPSALSNKWHGTPGAGMFALRNIKAGEVIIEEHPAAFGSFYGYCVCRKGHVV